MDGSILCGCLRMRGRESEGDDRKYAMRFDLIEAFSSGHRSAKQVLLNIKWPSRGKSVHFLIYRFIFTLNQAGKTAECQYQCWFQNEVNLLFLR